MTAPSGSFGDLSQLDTAAQVADASSGFVLGTIPPDVTFAHTELQPPTYVYVTKNDVLQAVVVSSVAVGSLGLQVRVLTMDGEIKVDNFTCQPVPSNRSLASFNFNLTEGFIIGAKFLPPPNLGLHRGMVYAVLNLCRPPGSSHTDFVQLIANYQSNAFDAGWPYIPLEHPISGPGLVRLIAGTVPAAGAEIVEVVPANARWRFISARFSLTTSAAVGNRTPRVIFSDGVNTFYAGPEDRTQAASLAYLYDACFSNTTAPTVPNDINLPIPSNVILVSAHDFITNMQWGTNTPGLAAGDQYSAPIYCVEEWLEP